MPSLGCGTCRELIARKVRCDQAYPKCNRCIKSGRHCKGYGMQLSWPRWNDTRRAIVGPRPLLRGRQAENRLVNTTFADIKLHDVVSMSTDQESFQYSVLKSALALASFHRANPPQTTAQYKVAALRKLAGSTQGRISVTDSACHIAAGMILSTLEIQQNSMKSSHWLWYACGAAKIVKTAGLDVDNLDHDTAALVGWVHYYNTLSRFSLRHWQPHITLDPDDAADSFHPVVCGYFLKPESLTGAPHEILYLLSEAFNAVTVPSDPRYETKAHRSHLEILDWKLRNLEKKVPDNNASADTTHPGFDLVVELYRLSTLIYLRRASAGILQLDQKFTTWVGQAFELLEQLPACQWPFPLLVFGCEAESDRQRTIILEVMERTTENMQYRNIATVKRVVETVWVQKDLYTEDMNYVRKLGVILSSTHKSVPAFI
ncbi:hypothetical protein FOC4_g10004825 [Fusarium odoratissimum]|uniref:Zn(2)-C6 fungal-type domain-containing protein n=1 Tax=Fusarium oxysporum f. sp. cubense (strain race 4) TaxID=2502994 RepID=N1RTQ0_FUSC4|nr:hypothetical protein FOC4_g10004825 [Fusarium odoratissimum]